MTRVKKLGFAVLMGTFIIISAFTINAINWQIKDGYSIKFSGSSASGKFEKINGSIAFLDPDNLSTSKMAVNVEVASIATGNFLKNSHAKSSKWFNADKYPLISFTSNSFSKSTSGFIVQGILEMHGVKKQISIPFTFQSELFKGSFSVDRIDYGVGTLEGMSKKVSNTMNLEISVPVVKK